MKFFSYGKDGGYESTVSGYWLIEIKRLFSIVLLCFENGSRDAYHSHAFDCISWVLRGRLVEFLHGKELEEFGIKVYTPSFRPITTRRETFHQVVSHGRTWVISFRGPWAKTWREYLPKEDRYVTLGDGRVELQ